MNSPLYLLLICLSAAVGLVYFIQKQSQFHKSEVLLLVCLFLVFTFEVLNLFLITQTTKKSILFTLSWFYFVPAILTCYFSQQVKNKQSKVIITGLMLATFFISGIGTDWYLPLYNYPNYFNFLPLWILVIALAGKTLYNILTQKDYADKNILSVPQFWVSTAVIFFFLETLFMLGVLSLFPDIEASFKSATLNFSHFLGGVMFLTFGFSFFAPTLFSKNYKFS